MGRQKLKLFAAYRTWPASDIRCRNGFVNDACIVARPRVNSHVCACPTLAIAARARVIFRSVPASLGSGLAPIFCPFRMPAGVQEPLRVQIRCLPPGIRSGKWPSATTRGSFKPRRSRSKRKAGGDQTQVVRGGK